jgi:hypothetical protein
MRKKYDILSPSISLFVTNSLTVDNLQIVDQQQIPNQAQNRMIRGLRGNISNQSRLVDFKKRIFSKRKIKLHITSFIGTSKGSIISERQKYGML